MKWLSAGLTFVNAATVSGLLLGMARGGLSKSAAVISLVLGLVIAVIAYGTTCDVRARRSSREVSALEKPKSLRRKTKEIGPGATRQNYKVIWLWLVGACFAIFALRSFCWLLYIDSQELKIQSPNNLGDMALHITHIRNFASGVPLWPENPIYSFSNLQYPAGIDLFDALLVKLHLDIRQTLIWTSLLGSLATFYAFWRWGGAFGVAGFLFNGGLASFQILKTWRWIDYQGVPTIAWKSVPLAMLVTQRGLLYAIPAGVLLLFQWHARFFPLTRLTVSDRLSADRRGNTQTGSLENQVQPGRLQPLPFWIECALYSSMPLFHLHTFMALSILLGFWFLIGRPAIRKQLLLLAGCAFLPATFFVWLVTNQFHAHHILQWKPGWVQTDGEFARPFFDFWFVNFGVTLPLVLLLIGFCCWRFWRNNTGSIFNLPDNLAFLIPAAVIFLFACNVKTAPWDWDNIKLIIWAYFIVLPFLWRDLIVQWPVEVRIGVCIAMFGSGFVTLIGGLAAGQPGYGFANRPEADAVGQAVRKLPVEARFAAYPTYNHPLLLNGRKVVLGYLGHLASQGFDYGPAEKKLTSLMQGTANWQATAHELRARYLFWGREEKIHYGGSTRPWEKTSPLVATGDWGAIYDLQPADKVESSPSPR